MPTRRQEKMARVVKEVVSDAISNHLSDPRITAFVSVTRINMTTDLRNANVYLSLFGNNQTAQKNTFAAIEHARSRIQSLLAGKIKSKFCPVLRFFIDEKFKKTLDTIRLVEKAAEELKENEQ